jgi:D-alanine-D-alanine ligase
VPGGPRILIVTGDHFRPDPTKPEARYHEEDFVAHRAMVAAFESLPGFRFEVCNDHSGLLERLRADPPALVLNFCDTGFDNQPTQELSLPAYLDLLRIPYSGAPPQALVLCYDKAIVRLAAEALGVPVPVEHFIAAEAPPDRLPQLYPALLKPNTGDGSVGITRHAVVRDAGEARAYLAWLRRTLPGRDALMQEYLPGPEYGLALLGNPETGLRALPALEVDFSALPEGLAPILAYESKAIPDSPYWTEIRFKRARIAPDLEARLARHARVMFKRLGLRDYGRFDFRLGADGEEKLLEVNPNPAWGNDGKLAFMAGFAGLEYRDLLRLVLEAALTRVGHA